jgi:hypothetical protein
VRKKRKDKRKARERVIKTKREIKIFEKTTMFIVEMDLLNYNILKEESLVFLILIN